MARFALPYRNTVPLDAVTNRVPSRDWHRLEPFDRRDRWNVLTAFLLGTVCVEQKSNTMFKLLAFGLQPRFPVLFDDLHLEDWFDCYLRFRNRDSHRRRLNLAWKRKRSWRASYQWGDDWPVTEPSPKS